MTRTIGRPALAMALACSFVLACTNDSAVPTGLVSPSAPTLSRSGQTGAKGGQNSNNSNNNSNNSNNTYCTSRQPAVNSGVFGPSGGTLTFGASRLIIPAGALHATVTITATVFGGNSSRVELQPHGLVFYKAAGLQLDTTGCDVDDAAVPDVVYLSDTGQVLETIKAVYDKRWHTIAAPIWHFSGYAIAF